MRGQRMIHEEYWGIHTAIDLKKCNFELITSREKIGDYVIGLCKLIEMERFGDLIIIHFGKTEKVAGYSFVQFIETSLISGHISNHNCNVYIDVFSCKEYKADQAMLYSKDYFQAESCNWQVTHRI